MSGVRIAWFNGLNLDDPADWRSGALGTVLDERERAALRRASGLRHAKIYGSPAALAALAASAAMRALSPPSERCGLIVAGLGHHLAPAWAFAKEAHTHGARLVTPMSFPGILPSAAPSAIAAAIGAKAFAFAVGADQSAFIEAINRAERCIRAGWADAVIVASACAADPLIVDVLKKAGAVRKPADAGVAALVWAPPLGNSDIEHSFEIRRFEDPEISIYCEYYKDVQFEGDSILNKFEFIFSASGIFCIEQARIMKNYSVKFSTKTKSETVSFKF